MLLEFVLENFRSVDEEQILSFYSSASQGGHLGNTVEFPEASCRMLKSIGFYGANASGKSNVLLALLALRWLVVHSHRLDEKESIPCYTPFAFGERNEAPTRFDLEFTLPIEGVETRFLYQISYQKTRIVEERLSRFLRGRKALLFVRRSAGDCSSVQMSFGASLRGGDRKISLFQNQAYLSRAGRNPSSPEILRNVYQYFRTGLSWIRLYDYERREEETADLAASQLVRFFDVGVTKIRKVSDPARIAGIKFPSNTPQNVRNEIEERLSTQYLFEHQTGMNEGGELELTEESDGTQHLFWFLPQIVRTLAFGGILLVDELESGMHPFMAETIVRLFNSPEVNKGQAQLLYTTHNSNLLSQDLLRRDQIWFTEKRKGRTCCFSLDEFDKKTVTPTSPYVRWYLEGRFGAVPSIDFAGLVAALVNLQGEKVSHA